MNDNSKNSSHRDEENDEVTAPPKTNNLGIYIGIFYFIVIFITEYSEYK